MDDLPLAYLLFANLNFAEASYRYFDVVNRFVFPALQYTIRTLDIIYNYKFYVDKKKQNPPSIKMEVESEPKSFKKCRLPRLMVCGDNLQVVIKEEEDNGSAEKDVEKVDERII